MNKVFEIWILCNCNGPIVAFFDEVETTGAMSKMNSHEGPDMVDYVSSCTLIKNVARRVN